jgi:hypothetical protein
VGYLRHTTRALAIIGHESPYFSMKTGVFGAKNPRNFGNIPNFREIMGIFWWIARTLYIVVISFV